MSKASTIAQPTVTLRWMMQRDLPQVLQITKQAPAWRWTQQDFLTVFQSADAAGWVAEIDDQVVGFLIYTVTWHLDSEDSAEAPEPRSRKGKNQQVPRPLRIVLLNLAVSPSWQRHGIGRALLERLSQKLRQLQDCIQATVPDSNLPVHLLLRSAGYKAVRVLRGHYGHEDGYLFERQIS